MMKTKAFWLLMVCALTAPAANAQVRINEVMQSNIDCLMVECDFPDSWVELYNPTSSDIDIQGYGLGVKENFSKAYKFEEKTIVPANGYLVIYCDKEERGLHTDFRVDSGKGEVYLFDPEGNKIDAVTLAKMPAPDIAYGRISDGAEEWNYFVKATPGAANAGAVSSELLPDPVFSAKGGVMSSPLTLTVSLPEDTPVDASLAVTLDGSEPTDADIVKSPYSIAISDTKVVRAKLVSDSKLRGRSVGQSFIFHPRELKMGVVSISTNPEYLYDPDFGILAGDDKETPNWMNDWRRPFNIEVYDAGTFSQSNNLLGEIRVKGGATRTRPQKSLALYANKRFGVKRFDSSNFWADKLEVKETKSFELRNSGNDFDGAHISDAFCQRMLGTHVGNVDWQAYEPVVLYINGVYHGIIDLRERSNDDYVWANYDGLEDIDMWENYIELKAGDEKSIDEFFAPFLSKDTTLAELSKIMDTDNFLSYLSMCFYGYHGDWLSNNSVIWRNTSEAEEGTPVDRRWRYIMKDLDHTLGRYGEKPEDSYFEYLRKFGDNDWDFAQKLHNLYNFFIDNKEGRELLIDRISCFLGDFLQPEYAEKCFKAMIEEISDEMEPTFARFFSPGEGQWYYSNWLSKIADDGSYITWIRQRPEGLYRSLQKEFGLGELVDLSIKTDGNKVAFNNNELSMPEFNGKYFTGRTITLSAVEGKKWIARITDISGNEKNEEFVGQTAYEVPVSAKSIAFSLEEDNAVDSIWSDDNAASEWFTLDGIRLAEYPQAAGIYIERRGSKTRKIVIGR